MGGVDDLEIDLGCFGAVCDGGDRRWRELGRHCHGHFGSVRSGRGWRGRNAHGRIVRGRKWIRTGQFPAAWREVSSSMRYFFEGHVPSWEARTVSGSLVPLEQGENAGNVGFWAYFFHLEVEEILKSSMKRRV